MYNGEVRKKIVKHPFFKQAKPLALMSLIRVRKTLTNCIHKLRKNQPGYLCLSNALRYIGNCLLAIWEGRAWQSDPDEPMSDWGFLTALEGFNDIVKAPRSSFLR